MNNFCRIYTAYSVSNDAMTHELCTLLNAASVTTAHLETETFDISIHSNDEFDAERQKEFPDGFLFFRNLIEFEMKSTDEESVQLAVELIGKILNYLWHVRRVAAVAACDYELLLPSNGGYKTTGLPWPG